MYELPVWDATALARMMGDNSPLHSSLLKKFLTLAQEQVAGISQAAGGDDTLRVARIAHALKSSSRTIGAMQLGEVCMKIELAGKSGDRASCKELAGQLNSAFSAVSKTIQSNSD